MNHVLDSYAVLAYLGNENGADTIETLLSKAKTGEINLFLNRINLGEIY